MRPECLVEMFLDLNFLTEVSLEIVFDWPAQGTETVSATLGLSGFFQIQISVVGLVKYQDYFVSFIRIAALQSLIYLSRLICKHYVQFVIT